MTLYVNIRANQRMMHYFKDTFVYILGYLEIYKQVSAQMSNDLKGHVNYCRHFSSGILPVCKL